MLDGLSVVRQVLAPVVGHRRPTGGVTSDRHSSRIHPVGLRAIVECIVRAAAGAQGVFGQVRAVRSSIRPEVSLLRGHPRLCPCSVELPGETVG